MVAVVVPEEEDVGEEVEEAEEVAAEVSQGATTPRLETIVAGRSYFFLTL